MREPASTGGAGGYLCTMPPTRSLPPHRKRAWQAWILPTGLVLAWLCIVLAVSAHHEFWRDEVRALSIAMDASSLSDLFRLMQDEGHPILWHLLLYGAYHATGSKLVLPVLSMILAGMAVFLLAFFSPFPTWLKALFIFSGLPLYEYSVMARNYGISMLLLFACAHLYQLRRSHPVVPFGLGIILALLANTNIHSLILASLLLGLWCWDTFVTEKNRAASAGARNLYAATAIVLLGIGGALSTVWPSGNMIVSDSTRYTAMNILRAVRDTTLQPAGQFSELFPAMIPLAIAGVVLLASMSGLIFRPALLVVACSGLWGLSVFFDVFYRGFYRHQGLFVCFLISLYWIMLAERGPIAQGTSQAMAPAIAWHGGLALLLLSLIWTGGSKLYADWRYGASASKALHGFVTSHPEYADAILIGEPDYFLESARYYLDNPVYLVRERRFGHVVRFVRSAQLDLGMGELLCSAWQIHQREAKPVLIALGHRPAHGIPMEPNSSLQSIAYPYRRSFRWTFEELLNWRRHTHLLQRFDPQVAGDESYAVYSLAQGAQAPEPPCPSGQ